MEYFVLFGLTELFFMVIFILWKIKPTPPIGYYTCQPQNPYVT